MTSAKTILPCAMKYLAPEMLASVLIGKGGAVIAAMRTSCQVQMALTEQSEYFPGTDCRVLTVKAATEDALNEAMKQIVGKISEYASASTADTLGTDDELKIKCLVPRSAIGGLIGKGGAQIKSLRESSGAKISIGEAIGSGPSAEQIVSLTGSAQALEMVLNEVNKQIQLLGAAAWFQTWATTPGTVSAGKGMGGVASYSGSGGYGGGGYPGVSHNPGIDTMMRVANGLPPYVMEDSRGFAMSCVVPNRLVGGLIGRGGQGTKEVQTMTGTKIGIREIPGDTENRSLNIAGPLPNTCAAYMLMMKRYLDAEAAAGPGSDESPPPRRKGGASS
eukprot:gnl/TRDRNA2_/TRDRNA2_184462_c0_seq1.p1 gnl/TRDRNA2_/TRDRNA2_184462_c0~~gnl/TRDRNA2_/TRDRNA2_184462_c0_seq1.p1  ORF type:complete len:360 (-),score=58.49 gnl/TRDRNA2_/TRDRNA2_184462_c0_seq1:72-1070(-)